MSSEDRRMLRVTLRGGSFSDHGFQIPGSCPICHAHIAPEFKHAYARRKQKPAQVAWRCTNEACDCLFVALYRWEPQGGYYALSSCEPIKPLKKQFSDAIAATSPNFISIYNDAHAAEQYGLMSICGPGYRKALEFLIKDFAIQGSPEDEAAIRSEFLGACIRSRVSDPKLKACVERATWLGNDETHYERRWEDQDLDDLKTLIELSVRWIESEELTAKYMAEMP